MFLKRGFNHVEAVTPLSKVPLPRLLNHYTLMQLYKPPLKFQLLEKCLSLSASLNPFHTEMGKAFGLY